MASRAQSVTVTYVAWDTTANTGKTGDVANHTLRWVKDGTSSAPTNSASEVDSTNAPGVYKITLTTTEATCDVGTLAGKSSTANVSIIPITIAFEQLPTAVPAASGGLLTFGSGTGQINPSSGAVPTSDGLKPTTAGRTLDVTATGEAGIDWANIGSPTTTVNFSGTTVGQLSGDVAGKVLGGGVSTITGTGARVVDGSGNAVAPASTALSTATWTGTRAGYLDNLSGGAVALASGVSVASGGITTSSFAAGAINAAAIAADAIGASELAADAVTEIVTGVLTTAMTEAYNTDGAAPTLAQALFLLISATTEFSISGTTITCKKLDGSTSAATYTLDSSTTPTSRTRAS